MPSVKKRTVKKTATKKKPGKKPASKKSTDSMSVVDKIQAMSVDDEGINLLVYGKSGSGKTSLWATFPTPILAIICSSGSGGELRSVPVEVRKKSKMVVISSSMDFEELIEHQDTTEEFQTVVLDHVSGLQDKILAELLEMDEIPEQKEWGLATMQEYGQCTLQTKEHLKRFFALRCNAVAIAHQRTFDKSDDDEANIVPHVGPGVMPGLASWLEGAADYVGQMFLRKEMKTTTKTIRGKKVTTKKATGKVEYCLRTAPDPTFMTKFRAPKGTIQVPEVIVDPDYTKIMEVIEGRRKSTTANKK